MPAWAYAAVTASIATSAVAIAGDEERRGAVYKLLWDDGFKRAMTLVICTAATLLLTFGDTRTRRAAEKALVAFFIAVLAEAHMSFAPFFLVLAVSFLLAT